MIVLTIRFILVYVFTIMIVDLPNHLNGNLYEVRAGLPIKIIKIMPKTVLLEKSIGIMN